MEIDLQQFCSVADFNDLFEAPFNIGKYTFATNRHIIVRVPLIKKYVELESSLSSDSILRIIQSAETATDLIPLVDWEKPELKECEDCGGTGRVDKCVECNGYGETQNHNIEPCEKCDTSGVVPGNEKDCPYCKGKGKKYPFFKPCLIGNGIYAAAEYIALIKALPNPHIGVSGKPDDAIPFKFTGGIGLLMPMRKD